MAKPVERPSFPSLLFGAIPVVAICFLVPLWDRVHPMVFGLPFNLFWLIAWIVLTPFFMAGAYAVESRRRRRGPG